MSRKSEARVRAASLARRRDELSVAVEEFRGALQGVSGTRLGAAWVLPIAAGALGIALAWSLRRPRKT